MDSATESPVEVFKTSRVVAWFYYAVGFLVLLLCVGGPVYLFVTTDKYKDPIRAFEMCLPIFFGVPLALACFAAAKTRVEIHPDCICKVSPFGTSRLMWRDTRGFFVRSKAGIILEPVKGAGRKMQLDLTLERTDELIKFLNRHLVTLE